ncbi:MAG: hypothetical protein EAX96_12515 [Candidatus Lokiarchaeota archaeon]|nr:hypothetical protein [Candidatus Lokiarchaeota archaeon]
MFDKLEDWPSDNIIKKLTIIAIILFPVSYLIMSPFFFLSGFPSTATMSSQLCFSGPILKSLYAFIVATPNGVFFYTIAQSADYFFMVVYGLLIFNLALFIGRKFDSNSNWRKSSYIISLFGIIAPSCDAVENAFILLTITDPLGFPDIWAVIHSVFALIKWILLILAIVWAFIAAIASKRR